MLPYTTTWDLIVHAQRSDFLCGQVHDLIWIRKVDPATIGYLQPLLYFKGFHAIQVQRISHVLWATNNLRKKMTALALQSRMAEVFGVDAHPGARISHSVMLDHASGIVIGETASIGHSCYILHGVTLGATGKSSSFDRHPKVRNNVKIGAGAMILGNIALEDGVVVGAGAVVTIPVPKVLPNPPAPPTHTFRLPASPFRPRPASCAAERASKLTGWGGRGRRSWG